jgi:hypothetical protein
MPLASSNEGHDLELVALGQSNLAMLRARDDATVVLYRHARPTDAKISEERGDRSTVRELVSLAVDLDSHGSAV